MSFIRAKEIPPGSGRWYDYEVENHREGNHVRQKVIRYIGRSGRSGLGSSLVVPTSQTKPSKPENISFNPLDKRQTMTHNESINKQGEGKKMDDTKVININLSRKSILLLADRMGELGKRLLPLAKNEKREFLPPTVHQVTNAEYDQYYKPARKAFNQTAELRDYLYG